ncbi:HipA N-terminal domain-containing protein [Ochrobactrum sp. SFR4]|uniref:HipA N-terminal domain-containing protein n=1 Tax=Ochrobactrum sp. SFR4 TaxID=2717368 RepID=UPI001C8B7F1B|nr:hypothetical protein [Ochrobactrum sp. SFR4]
MTRSSRDIPTWFSNLLPEGALKELVLKGMPSGETTDFDVLRWLGKDLPGAVSVRSEETGQRKDIPPPLEDGQTGIRFSLACPAQNVDAQTGGTSDFSCTGCKWQYHRQSAE